MNRPDYLRDQPLHDRSDWPMEWTWKWRVQVADLFCGRGGVGRALDRFFPRNMFFGVDVEDYSSEYPGEFVQADLIGDRPFEEPIADVAWVSFPCTAYSSLSATEHGSAEAALDENPRITDELREWLLDNFAHYVIENVPRATYHGDLKANVRLNGLAFGLPFSSERHFETTFECPDAFVAGEPEVTIDTRGDQSVEALAEAKGVPASWGKQGVRSAMPWQFVFWILNHCPAVPCPRPKRKQWTIEDATGDGGAFVSLPGGYCGGHICEGECDGNHGPSSFKASTPH